MDSPAIKARSDLAVATSTPRVTPTTPRVDFKRVLTNSLVRSAETAMRVLPGGPLMAVAIRGGGPGPAGSLGVPVTGVGASPLRAGAEGPAPLAGGVPGALSPTGATPGAAGAPAGEASSVEASLQQSQEMNLYYLQIQEAVNAQNRSFTALSNVLKAEHDTVKTAIGNIR
ncbi:MAG: hypothetical protein JST00_20480 [Deltaproteobacteria bacterium]|nr:hypothetical protein [Deltaproteobacteria bacterium]